MAILRRWPNGRAGRGGEHFDDVAGRTFFGQGGQVGTGNGRREQRVSAFYLVKRDDLKDRQPVLEPAQPGAFTRQPVADFEEPARIGGRDFKYRAVVTAARPLNGGARDIELGGRPACICRF
jgi:hypothetical protein